MRIGRAGAVALVAVCVLAGCAAGPGAEARLADAVVADVPAAEEVETVIHRDVFEQWIRVDVSASSATEENAGDIVMGAFAAAWRNAAFAPDSISVKVTPVALSEAFDPDFLLLDGVGDGEDVRCSRRMCSAEADVLEELFGAQGETP